MLEGQIRETVDTIRNIVGSLRQAEYKNMNLASKLYQQQLSQAANLNQNLGSVPDLARQAEQAAQTLNQITVAENNAVEQLEKIEQMLIDLKERMH